MKVHGYFVLVLGAALTLVSAVRAGEDAEPEVSAAELRLKAAELMREARELKQTGNEAQARELAEQAGQLLREVKLAEPSHEHAEPHERLQALRQRIMQLRQEGRMEEAERLEREARQSIELLHKHHGGDDPHRHPPEEAERRMHHLRVAAENLHAAGFHEQAEKLVEQAQRLAAARKVRPMDPGHDGRMDELIGHLRRLTERVERLEQAMKKMIEQQQP